jgi:transcriptional regulator with XRE-family HTH domain
MYEEDDTVTPDGLGIRRRRRLLGCSRRAFVEVMARASVRESGRRETITVNLLEGIEETNEPVPYATLCRVAAGLDCDPVELVVE